jgi:hypothetical protein
MKAHDTWLGSTTGHIFRTISEKGSFCSSTLATCVCWYLYIYIKRRNRDFKEIASGKAVCELVRSYYIVNIQSFLHCSQMIPRR